MSEAKPGLRIDKWLWQARFFKTRSLAAKLVQSGKLRLNGELISKPSRVVSEGDVLLRSVAVNATPDGVPLELGTTWFAGERVALVVGPD